jgi:hypothetical protein
LPEQQNKIKILVDENKIKKCPFAREYNKSITIEILISKGKADSCEVALSGAKFVLLFSSDMSVCKLNLARYILSYYNVKKN